MQQQQCSVAYNYNSYFSQPFPGGKSLRISHLQIIVFDSFSYSYGPSKLTSFCAVRISVAEDAQQHVYAQAHPVSLMSHESSREPDTVFGL